MQLPLDTLIAGQKTVRDWNEIRDLLLDFTNLQAWTTAFELFFKVRLDDRYLTTIKTIQQNGNLVGEGFSIMTIICSLIEFLESSYQGTNYRYVRRNDPPLAQHEYSSSSQLFISFLSTRPPFNSQFNVNTARRFYEDVRCGLLHEARTKGIWVIWGVPNKKGVVHLSNTQAIIYTNEFYNAIIEFINVHYRNDLLNSIERKEAFVRKFDSLCEI